MKRILTFLALIICIVSVQAQDDLALNTEDVVTTAEENVVLTLEVEKKHDGDHSEGGTWGKGSQAVGGSFGLGYSGGINDGSVKDRKTSDIDFDMYLKYEYMFCDCFGLSPFVAYDTEILTGGDIFDGRNVTNQFTAGVAGHFYQRPGDCTKGGFVERVHLGAGFERSKNVNPSDTFKDPIHPILKGGASFGGWYQPTPCVMVFVALGVMSFETTWIRMGEFESSPNMRVTNFDMSIRNWIPQVGLKYTFGGGKIIEPA